MRVLGQAFPGAQFGEAEDGPQAVEAALTEPWDLVLLDIAMPGGGGLEALRLMRLARPRLRVLIVSMYAERHLAARAFKAGAVGYLDKASASSQLIHAVKRIRDGGQFLSAAMTEHCAAVLIRNTDDLLHQRLSFREFEILQNIVAGRTMPEIADDLSLSIHTVDTYRKRVLGKMQMRHNSDLTSYALSNPLGWVQTQGPKVGLDPIARRSIRQLDCVPSCPPSPHSFHEQPRQRHGPPPTGRADGV